MSPNEQAVWLGLKGDDSEMIYIYLYKLKHNSLSAKKDIILQTHSGTNRWSLDPVRGTWPLVSKRNQSYLRTGSSSNPYGHGPIQPTGIKVSDRMNDFEYTEYKSIHLLPDRLPQSGPAKSQNMGSPKRKTTNPFPNTPWDWHIYIH